MNLKLLPLCLSIALIGIFLLLAISNLIQPKYISINQIDNSLLNKQIKIQATTFNIKSFEDSNFQILSVKDKTGKIDITTNKILNLENNQTLTIIGKVVQYKEYLQIQSTLIKKEEFSVS